MNPFAAILGVFKKKPGKTKETNQRWMAGYKAIEHGKEFCVEKKFADALACFDTAIAAGFGEEAHVFSMRGTCLQALDWDTDAIDDFSNAISVVPEDCNLFFQRAMSKISIGDKQGFVSDIKEAIRLSRLDSKINEIYHEHAREMNHASATMIYQFQLSMHAEQPDFITNRNGEKARLRGRRAPAISPL